MVDKNGTTDVISLSALQFAQRFFQGDETYWGYYVLGARLGFTKAALRAAYAEFYAPLVSGDPHVLHILERLNRFGLPIPQKFPVIPQNSDPKKFTMLVYVDPVISIPDLLDVIIIHENNIVCVLDLSKIRDIVETPKGPYFIWAQSGALYKNKTPEQAQEMFAPNERGITVCERLFYSLFYPKFF